MVGWKTTLGFLSFSIPSSAPTLRTGGLRCGSSVLFRCLSSSGGWNSNCVLICMCELQGEGSRTLALSQVGSQSGEISKTAPWRCVQLGTKVGSLRLSWNLFPDWNFGSLSRQASTLPVPWDSRNMKGICFCWVILSNLNCVFKEKEKEKNLSNPTLCPAAQLFLQPRCPPPPVGISVTLIPMGGPGRAGLIFGKPASSLGWLVIEFFVEQ